MIESYITGHYILKDTVYCKELMMKVPLQHID